MKFFTKLFLVVALLLPTVAGAEQIAPITFNPSRSGWYRNLKVVSSLSFSPSLQIQTLNIGATGKTNSLVLPIDNDTNVINTRSISQPEEAKTATIEFSKATLTRGNECQPNCTTLTTNISGGKLMGENGFVELSNSAGLPVYGDKVSWASTTSSFQVKGIAAGAPVLEKNVAGTETSFSKSNITGWKLGPYEIPYIDANGKCFKWKNVTINGISAKVLVLTSSGC